MSLARLIFEAEKVVAALQASLPPELQGAARGVPVIYYDRPSPEILGGEFTADILGLFVGEAASAEPGAANSAPAHILLFLESIFEESEEDWEIFRDEVRLTYLHELGHSFGWNEEDLELRGLG